MDTKRIAVGRMATKTQTRLERRQQYRRVEYKCKLCQEKNFGDPETALLPLQRERGFLLWLSGIAAHVTVHHPMAVGTLPFNNLVVANYS